MDGGGVAGGCPACRDEGVDAGVGARDDGVAFGAEEGGQFGVVDGGLPCPWHDGDYGEAQDRRDDGDAKEDEVGQTEERHALTLIGPYIPI